jgi:predicted transposase/invertase (TIGR01784 family)
MLQDTILTYSEEAELRGIEKGKKESWEEGRQEGKEEVARNLIAHGVPTDIIVKSTGLPLDKIQTLMH